MNIRWIIPTNEAHGGGCGMMLAVGDKDNHIPVDVNFGLFIVGAGAMSGFGDAKCSLAFDDNHFRPPVDARKFTAIVPIITNL